MPPDGDDDLLTDIVAAAEVPGTDLRQTVGHIRRINTILGVHVPALVTPLELIGEQE